MSESYSYYIALVEPDNTVIIRQNDKHNRAIIKNLLTEKTKIYRVRGHTISEAVSELSKYLGVELVREKRTKRKQYREIEELKSEEL